MAVRHLSSIDNNDEHLEHNISMGESTITLKVYSMQYERLGGNEY